MTILRAELPALAMFRVFVFPKCSHCKWVGKTPKLQKWQVCARNYQLMTFPREVQKGKGNIKEER